MAKDTEKLIRQLSLISYLMAERRPVTALEIRRDVEGYSGMNEDAFARRFYADRAELESLGIQLTVDKPLDAGGEQETYSLRPENFHLPAIAFSDAELAALHTALGLLDGEFAYAEPLRLALQQISWGRPSPLNATDGLKLKITASAGGHDLSQRLAKVETAIFRHKTITFDYYSLQRDSLDSRKVDPYHLLFQGGQFYLVGRSHERDAMRVFRLDRIRGKVAYATKAEHDFKSPSDFDPRAYANRAEWQFGSPVGEAEIRVSERIAWQVARHYGRFGAVHEQEDGAIVLRTAFADRRQLASFVLGLGEHATVLGPPELADFLHERVDLLRERHTDGPELAAPVHAQTPADDAEEPPPSPSRAREASIRPERFARLVTLATILIEAGRRGVNLAADDVRERLQVSQAELHEDINVLNVVSFGGGTYVLYAELRDDGTIEVDPEPYADNFARPARLLPVEAKALVAAIDLIGEHLPSGGLTSAREKIVAALGGEDPRDQLHIASATADDPDLARRISVAIHERRLVRIEYYKEHADEFSERVVEPYHLMNGLEGWYLAVFDPEKDDVRHFRLDRIKSAEVLGDTFRPRDEVRAAAELEGWARTGELEASRTARIWVSPDRARWEREEHRVAEELADGAIIIERGYKGADWLVREILKEAGDAAVLEPAEAREAVRAAVERLRTPAAAR
jgi:proteasome accessory factor BC